MDSSSPLCLFTGRIEARDGQFASPMARSAPVTLRWRSGSEGGGVQLGRLRTYLLED